MRKSSKQINERPSLFSYDEKKNILNLKAQLPHSFTLEKTLLSCVLVNCDTSFQTLEILMEHLPVDAFYFKNHQKLYQTFIKMYHDDLAIDLFTATDYIQCHGLVQDVGGLQVINELLKEIPTLVYLMDYIRLVKQKYIRRCIIKIGLNAKYKRILTGSPVTKSPLDLYKQCEFLDPWLLDHASYYSFRTRYAVMKTANFGGRSVQIVVGYRNLGELSDRLKNFSYRVLKDDCLDLPEKTFIKRLVTLTPDQKKLYLQMKNLALAQMDGKMMTTATVMTQLMRLQQITCGHFTADDGTIKDLDSNILLELMNVLEEVEGKIVIWAHWQRDVNRIIREIVKKYGENSFVDYYGPTPMSDRQENIKKFQDPNSPVRFFVGTTQTGGYGITLTAASTMIYYSNGYDLEKRQQSEARIDRIGQKYPMTYIDIYCENTVDSRIVKALKKKVNIASQIMGEELKDWI